jgi:hypothetical protein
MLKLYHPHGPWGPTRHNPVLGIMDLAPLDEGPVPEDPGDRRGQRFPPVDDDQEPLPRIRPSASTPKATRIACEPRTMASR